MSQGFWCWFKLESDLTWTHLNRWLADCPETIEILESDSLPARLVNQLDHQKNSPVMDAAFLGRSLIAPWHTSLVFKDLYMQLLRFLEVEQRWLRCPVQISAWHPLKWCKSLLMASWWEIFSAFFVGPFFVVPIWWQIMIQNQRNIQRCKVV